MENIKIESKRRYELEKVKARQVEEMHERRLNRASEMEGLMMDRLHNTI